MILFIMCSGSVSVRPQVMYIASAPWSQFNQGTRCVFQQNFPQIISFYLVFPPLHFLTNLWTTTMFVYTVVIYDSVHGLFWVCFSHITSHMFCMSTWITDWMRWRFIYPGGYLFSDFLMLHILLLLNVCVFDKQLI